MGGELDGRMSGWEEERPSGRPDECLRGCVAEGISGWVNECLWELWVVLGWLETWNTLRLGPRKWVGDAPLDLACSHKDCGRTGVAQRKLAQCFK